VPPESERIAERGRRNEVEHPRYAPMVWRARARRSVDAPPFRTVASKHGVSTRLHALALSARALPRPARDHPGRLTASTSKTSPPPRRRKARPQSTSGPFAERWNWGSQKVVCPARVDLQINPEGETEARVDLQIRPKVGTEAWADFQISRQVARKAPADLKINQEVVCEARVDLQIRREVVREPQADLQIVPEVVRAAMARRRRVAGPLSADRSAACGVASATQTVPPHRGALTKAGTSQS
jgi:hypothetical protein